MLGTERDNTLLMLTKCSFHVINGSGRQWYYSQPVYVSASQNIVGYQLCTVDPMYVLMVSVGTKCGAYCVNCSHTDLAGTQEVSPLFTLSLGSPVCWCCFRCGALSLCLCLHPNHLISPTPLTSTITNHIILLSCLLSHLL